MKLSSCLAKIPVAILPKFIVDIPFICLSLFCDIVWMLLFPLYPLILKLLTPLLNKGMFFSHVFLLLFCLLILPDVGSMHLLLFFYHL